MAHNFSQPAGLPAASPIVRNIVAHLVAEGRATELHPHLRLLATTQVGAPTTTAGVPSSSSTSTSSPASASAAAAASAAPHRVGVGAGASATDSPIHDVDVADDADARRGRDRGGGGGGGGGSGAAGGGGSGAAGGGPPRGPFSPAASSSSAAAGAGSPAFPQGFLAGVGAAATATMAANQGWDRAARLEVLVCVKGCGAAYHLSSGTIADTQRVLVPGVDACAGAAPATPAADTAPTGTAPVTAAQLAAIPATSVPALMRAKVPSQADVLHFASSPAARTGDPTLPSVQPSSPAARGRVGSAQADVLGIAEMSLIRAAAQLARTFDALRASEEHLLQALPRVLVAPAVNAPTTDADQADAGATTPPARAPILDVVCDVIRCVHIAIGALAADDHMVLGAPAWTANTGNPAAWIVGPDGNRVPVGTYWHCWRFALLNDKTINLPAVVRSPPRAWQEAVQEYADASAPTLHGAGASVLTFLPRLGMLHAKRRDAAAALHLAALWQAIQDAIVQAADHARKEAKALSLPRRSPPDDSRTPPPNPAGGGGAGSSGP